MNNIYAPYTFDEMLSAIGFLKDHQQVALSDAQIKTHLTRMMNGSLINTWKLNAHSFRIREAREGHLETNLSGLVAKKPPHDRYGRCTTKENSAYYAALNIETALLESNAEEGKLYQILELLPQKDIQLDTVIVGWLDYLRRHKSPPPLLTGLRGNQARAARELIEREAPEEATKQILFDAFIADQFRKIVPDDNDEEYRTTALYSSLLLESNKFEQILYPSVANFGGWNVAIRPDLVTERLEISSVQLIRVDKDLGYGMYDCTVVGHGALSGSEITWTCDDNHSSESGTSPFYQDTIRDPFSRLSYARRVEKALGTLPNDAGNKQFLYVLNVHVSDYGGPIATDEYVFNELDDQSLSALRDLLEVCDLNIRNEVVKNAKYLLATDSYLNLDCVERHLQDRFGDDLAGSTRSILLSYKTQYRDWGARYRATENRLSITVQSVNEILELCHG